MRLNILIFYFLPFFFFLYNASKASYIPFKEYSEKGITKRKFVLKFERIQEFIHRLNNYQACDSSDEAFEILAKVLNEVEDELSGIPYSPHLWMTDGRMYPPQDDSRRITDNPKVIRYRNKGHNTFIGANGSLKIVALRGKIIIDKAGLDGRKVNEL